MRGRLYRSRNYTACLAYLTKAHADCQHRAQAAAQYQGVVVIHPGYELGLVQSAIHSVSL